MANLARKDGIFLIRFRHQGKEYKRSLKTRDRDAAEAAKHQVELTIHRLLTGMASMPPEADPAEFIVSGGTRSRPPEPVQCPVLPSIRSLIPEYLESQRNLAAPSYHGSQKIHPGHLQRHLDTRADVACDRLPVQVLDAFLQARLAKRNPLTVERERITMRQFFKWVVAQGYLETSPAAALPPIHGGKDRPPFRTVAEVNHAIHRGGLTEVEILGLWECRMSVSGARRNCESAGHYSRLRRGGTLVHAASRPTRPSRRRSPSSNGASFTGNDSFGTMARIV